MDVVVEHDVSVDVICVTDVVEQDVDVDEQIEVSQKVVEEVEEYTDVSQNVVEDVDE